MASFSSQAYYQEQVKHTSNKMVTLPLWIPVLALAFVTAVESANRLKVYDHPGLHRADLILDKTVGTDCTNLRQIDNRASSVSTSGNCVYLYEGFFCTGQRIRVFPETPIKNLYDLNFDNVLSSVRACCPQIQRNNESCTSCQGENETNSFPASSQTAQLIIYKSFDYQDRIHEMALTDECSNLEKINDQASSVDTRGTCVILYEDMDCMGSHITVFPGSNHHKNLDMLQFDKEVSSVRACYEQRNWEGFDPTSAIIPGIV